MVSRAILMDAAYTEGGTKDFRKAVVPRIPDPLEIPTSKNPKKNFYFFFVQKLL